MIPRIAFSSPEDLYNEAEAHANLSYLCGQMAMHMQQEDEEGELPEEVAELRDEQLRQIRTYETALSQYAEQRLRRGVAYSKSLRKG